MKDAWSLIARLALGFLDPAIANPAPTCGQSKAVRDPPLRSQLERKARIPRFRRVSDSALPGFTRYDYSLCGNNSAVGREGRKLVLSTHNNDRAALNINECYPQAVSRAVHLYTPPRLRQPHRLCALPYRGNG
jgi:hypothetical protein